MATALQIWRRLINQQLEYFADNLPFFGNLQSLNFETSCENDADDGPRWNCLYAAIVFHLVQKLPIGLPSLNLDICGAELVDNGGNGIRICPLLGQRLKKSRTVRLPLRSICSRLFQDCDVIGSLDKLIITHGLLMYAD